MNSKKKNRVLEVAGMAAVVALLATVTLSAGRTTLACDKNNSNAKAAAVQGEHTGQAMAKTAQATRVLTCPVTGATVKVAANCEAQQATAKTAGVEQMPVEFRTAEVVSGHACPAAQAAAKTAAAEQACSQGASMKTAAATEQACTESQASVTKTAAVTEGKTCNAKNASKMADAEKTSASEKENTAQVIR